MSKNRSSNVEAALEQLDREASGDVVAGRYIDFAMAFVLEHPANENAVPLQEVLLRVGGRWDRRLKDFDGKPETGVLVRLHKGQRGAVSWFGSWLEAHRERRVTPPEAPPFEDQTFEVDADPTHAYAALFAGGRRGGKTWIAVAIAVLYAAQFPGAIVWIVSPNHGKHREVREYLKGHLPQEWLERETSYEYDLLNGSQIILKSGHDPDLLKEGKANLVVLNEGQMMDARAFTVARGAIVDKSGLVIVCANPPVGKKEQTWVSEFAAEAAAGRRAAVYVEFNPLHNPHIDRVALLSMQSELDERSYAIEVLGHFRGPANAVAYNWIRRENERAVPSDYLDVTERFLDSVGEGEGLITLVGLDVQRIPYIGGPWYRFYVPPGVFPSPENVLAWIVGETVLEGGDEVEFCAELAEAELEPEHTLIVCDGTAEYQHSRRRANDMAPPEWKGRGSFSIIRGEGYSKIVPPDRRLRRKNPPVQDRIRAFNSMICSGTGVRRLFADPVKAPKTCAAIRDWRQVHGSPSRTQDAAHLGDGASYPIIRLFPRRLRPPKSSGNPRPDVQDPVASRVDLVQPPPARAPVDQRITPPAFGQRRGTRTRGM